MIEAIAVQSKEDVLLIPLAAVAVLFSAAIPLNGHLEEIERYIATANDIYLVQDVLDIPIGGVHVARAGIIGNTHKVDEVYQRGAKVRGSQRNQLGNFPSAYNVSA